VSCFHEDVEGILWFNDRITVPKKDELRKKILDEAHTSKYSIHPDSTKMYQDFRAQFWWTRTKRETARYVSECDTCRKVKANYMKPGGLLQPLSIPGWKWEDISMNFVVGLPLTDQKFNSIWVIVDRFIRVGRGGVGAVGHSTGGATRCSRATRSGGVADSRKKRRRGVVGRGGLARAAGPLRWPGQGK
jgi:hypothetical protein